MTFSLLKKETDPFVRTLVLDHFDVCLFLGVKNCPDDFYYELVKFKKNSYYASCVGRIIPLKEKLSKEHYNYLVQVWNFNNEQKAK